MSAMNRKTIEVYEVHSRSSVMSKWKPASQSFASKDGHGCEHRDVLSPAPGFEWDGGWQLDMSNFNGAAGVGETDKDGWDYATDKNRFGPGQGAHRIPRGPGLKVRTIVVIALCVLTTPSLIFNATPLSKGHVEATAMVSFR